MCRGVRLCKCASAGGGMRSMTRQAIALDHVRLKERTPRTHRACRPRSGPGAAKQGCHRLPARRGSPADRATPRADLPTIRTRTHPGRKEALLPPGKQALAFALGRRPSAASAPAVWWTTPTSAPHVTCSRNTVVPSNTSCACSTSAPWTLRRGRRSRTDHVPAPGTPTWPGERHVSHRHAC
jgi:hypothetical protein